MARVSVTEITKALKGMTFPAEKDDLMEHARSNDAGKDVLTMMDNLPDEEYGSITDVMSAFGDLDGRGGDDEDEDDTPKRTTSAGRQASNNSSTSEKTGATGGVGSPAKQAPAGAKSGIGATAKSGGMSGDSKPKSASASKSSAKSGMSAAGGTSGKKAPGKTQGGGKASGSRS
jgi:hypothetical protein